MTVIEIYIANRIIFGALKYTDVILKRPDIKVGIDEYLTSTNNEGFIQK